MGRSIEDIIQGLRETYVICRSVYAYDRKKYIDGAIDRLNKYQMLKADYENRLRADIVAKLEEIKEKVESVLATDLGEVFIRNNCRDVIQEKINELKADQEIKE